MNIKFKLLLTICSLFFLSFSGKAEEKEVQIPFTFDSYEPLFVSLGSFCDPAYLIRKHHLRKAAFPLDWMLSVNGEKLIRMLEERFSNFLNEEHLKSHPTNGIMLHHAYELEFSHEGNWCVDPETYAQKLSQLKEKYQRRIARFLNLNTYRGKIYFIRASWSSSMHPNYIFHDPGNLFITEEYATRLYRALKTLFPNPIFKLVIVNQSEEESTKIIGNILMIYTKKFEITKIINQI